MLFLRYYLWIVPHVILGVLLFSLLRLRLQRRLPFFLSYVVFEIAQFLSLLILNVLPAFSRAQYSRVFVFGLILSTFLKVGVMYELGRDLLVSRPVQLGASLPLMRWIAAPILLIGASASAFLSAARLEKVEGLFHFLQLSVSVMLTVLIIVLFLFTKFLRVSWRSQSAGIALGFGIYAAVEVATAAMRVNFPDQGNIVIDLLQMIAYHAAAVIWLVYVALLRPVPNFSGCGLQTSELQMWDQDLQRMVEQ